MFGHQVRLPKTVHLLNPGRIKRVRGVAYATGVSTGNNARMIESARGVLNPLVGDTYIFSDVGSAGFVEKGSASLRGEKKKLGLGFGLSLVAESSTGTLYSADLASGAEGGELPEDVGTRCVWQLLEGVQAGGAVEMAGVKTVLVLMAMGSEDVGRVVLGRDVAGSEEVVQLARDLRKFGAGGWGLRDADGETANVVISIVGRGVGNVGRKIA